jgi:hypothetical protein
MVGFEWDAAEAKANEQKHGIKFSDEAVSVFEDDHAITVSDTESDPSEERFITIGMSYKARLLVVVYGYRGETIRIISGRKATSAEEEEYFGI